MSMKKASPVSFGVSASITNTPKKNAKIKEEATEVKKGGQVKDGGYVKMAPTSVTKDIKSPSVKKTPKKKSGSRVSDSDKSKSKSVIIADEFDIAVLDRQDKGQYGWGR